MGHNIRHEDYPLTVNKQKVEASWNEYVRHEDWQEGASGLPNPIRWVDRVFDSYNDAYAYIEREDRNHWYNCMAVKYKDYPTPKPSKSLADLNARVKAQQDNLNKIVNDSGIQHRTSEYIGCEKCGSKLKRTLLKGNKCPLCGEDLRSKTNLDRIANATAKLTKLREQYAEAYEAEQKKAKYEIRWLVKVEYHT